MNLKIKPYHKNTYPLNGYLIKYSKVKYWLDHLQHLNIDLEEIKVYAIPNNSPNSIWGCFVLSKLDSRNIDLSNITFCQSIQNTLFIPEHSLLFPKINSWELDTLFPKNAFILHPEFGLFELEEAISWSSLLALPNFNSLEIIEPTDVSFIPDKINKIELISLSPDETLKNLEENKFPKKESFKNEALSHREKLKYILLKPFFQSGKNQNPIESQDITTSKLNRLALLLGNFFPNAPQIYKKLNDDFKELDKRNRSEINKLFDLFKNNPAEALKYAIPIDNEGITRGGDISLYKMVRRWTSFELFQNSKSLGSGKIILQDDTLVKLQSNYEQAAKKFIENKEYEKAVFIYLKLLKNNHQAALTFENAQMYPEAASIYLKYVNHKEKAAQCYEKGRMITDAIKLYKEMNMNEKVGDLFISINNKDEAFKHYNIILNILKTNRQYVKASLLLRNKMDDTDSAQDLLLSGWHEETDSFNCINNYFNNIEDPSLLSKEINSIYKKDTNDRNKPEFLKALKYIHKKEDKLKEQTQDLAYEIVSDLAKIDPKILNELSSFNKDRQLTKDIVRYKTKKSF